jgi:phenylacetate-CoA ligase
MNPYSGLRRLRFEAYFATMPIHAWMIRGPQTRRSYLELKKSEFANRETLSDLQLSRLQKIISHAYNTSSFYRRRLDEVGFHPNDLTSIEQLPALPLLSKDDVRDNLEIGLLSTAVTEKNRLKINTSGSTGRPFTIYADRNQLEVRFAATIRALEQTGWQFGDRQARLWHQKIGMSKSQIIREKIDAWFLKRLFIPAFEISQSSIEQLVVKIEKQKPVLIDGYAESLNFLAIYAQRHAPDGISPLAIMSSAQALPANTRKIIEEAFNTRVFDKYGSREFSGIAYECSAHTHHHVVDECYKVELLVNNRPAQPGEVGEVVITDLFNRATPLIRYRIGDLAVAVDPTQACSCGRSHTQIGEIEGRTQAIVHCESGRWLPGTFFSHFFKEYDKLIRFFQITQHIKGSFILSIVAGDEYSDKKLNEMLVHLRNYIGNSTIQVNIVSKIPMIGTGKRSPVISTVVEDFQDLQISRQIRTT